MNAIWIVIGNTIITTSAILSAACLAYHGKEGWGWLIFCAIVCGVGGKELFK